jgi:hypothetical protein
VFNSAGLVATIVTFHPAILLLSLLGAGLLALPVALLLYAQKVKRWKLLLASFFVGVTLVSYFTITRRANLTSVEVEVVKVWGPAEGPAKGAP